MAILTDASDSSKRPTHQRIVVFIPAYEGSLLYDHTLAEPGSPPICVWGSVRALRWSQFYFSLRLPNPLEPRPMLWAGPIDVYSRLVMALTRPVSAYPNFVKYREGVDFFIHPYDWRQDLGDVLAPQLGQALERFAAIHAAHLGDPDLASRTEFILISHSMGGLVARTLIHQQPRWAERIAKLYLVGTPNQGSIKAVKTLMVGPGGIKQNAVKFPVSLLGLLPTDVGIDVSKLVAITRPSIYALQPTHSFTWKHTDREGNVQEIDTHQIMEPETWRPFWPAAEMERKLYLETWLQKQVDLGRKGISPPQSFLSPSSDVVSTQDYEFCQDPHQTKLKKLLAQAKVWRSKLGSLHQTEVALRRGGERSRLRLIVGTRLSTPSGIETGFDGHRPQAQFLNPVSGDQTVTCESALDNLDDLSLVNYLAHVPHARLPTHRQFLNQLWRDLSSEEIA